MGYLVLISPNVYTDALEFVSGPDASVSKLAKKIENLISQVWFISFLFDYFQIIAFFLPIFKI
jgi:hypothetical protein